MIICKIRYVCKHNDDRGMINAVTNNFIKCHNELKDRGIVRSTRQFALQIGTHSQCMNDILKHRRNATVDMLYNIVHTFNVNPMYLFYGFGEMFHTEQPYIPNIKYLEVPAYAGSLDQYFDATQQNEELFAIPGYSDQSGEHRCFDVAGDSMEPTLYANDKVICSRVFPVDGVFSVRNNHIYVVVTTSEILVKRVLDRQSQNRALGLISDNDYYDEIVLPTEGIVQLWRVNMRIESFVAHPKHVRTGMHDDIYAMQDTIKEQAASIRELNRSIEHLLKKSRS